MKSINYSAKLNEFNKLLLYMVVNHLTFVLTVKDYTLFSLSSFY